MDLTQRPVMVASADEQTRAFQLGALPNGTPVQVETARAVDALLKKAGHQWAEKHWTRPYGDNALETYRLVLSLEPENQKAQQGLVLMRDAFLRQAGKATSRGDYAAARRDYQKVLVVDPDYVRTHGELAQLPEHGATPALSPQQAQTTKTSDAAAALRAKMQTFLASAEVGLRDLLKTVKYEGGKRTDLARPER